MSIIGQQVGQAMRDFWHRYDPHPTTMLKVAPTDTVISDYGNRRNLTATLTAVRDRAIAAEKMARDVEHRLLGPMPADAKTISPSPQGESLIASALAAEAAISSVMGTLQRLLGELEQPLQAEKATYGVR